MKLEDFVDVQALLIFQIQYHFENWLDRRFAIVFAIRRLANFWERVGKLAFDAVGLAKFPDVLGLKSNHKSFYSKILVLIADLTSNTVNVWEVVERNLRYQLRANFSDNPGLC